MGLLVVPVEVSNASAAPRSGNGRIVFTRFTTSNVIEDVYTVRPPARRTTRLTNTPDVSDVAPAWSPDGQRIALHRGDRTGAVDGIYLMAADGSGLAQVPNTEQGGFPSWSPDGAQLAFERRDADPQGSGLWAIGVDGTGLRQLLAAAGGGGHDPAWSPSGQEIAFSRVSPNQSGQSLLAIDPSNGVERVLTPATVGV